MQKKNNLKYDLVLNENHIKRIKNEKKEIIQYNEVYKIKEDAKKFVFVLKEFSIKILKSQCRKEDITFIRKIIHKKEDENNDNIKNIKLSKKLNSIFNITLILFFIMLVINLYLTKKVVNNLYKYMWSMIFILPFSIKSIIMGLKYKDCTRNRKNIISGILITFLAIIYSLLTLIPINNNYSKAFQFERILGIELPDTGIYQKEEINTSYHYFAHEFLFLNKNEYLLTEKEIKANNNWVKLDGMTKDVIYFLPILCSYDCYYSIYFEEANKYNKLPKEEGKYHIYAMLYDEKQHILRIDEYNYNL